MENRNVILITIDCLRADHVGCLGYDRNTTPNIDKLAEEGTLFTQAISQGGTTQPSFQSILTSTYPLMFDTYRSFTQYRDPIAEILKENGFTTAAFHENPQVSRYYGFDRGFRTFDDFMSLDRKSGGKKSILSPVAKKLKGSLKELMEDMMRESKLLQKFRRTSMGNKLEEILGIQNVASAEEINAKAIGWLKNHKEDRFFLWIHYMDTHTPLIPPLKLLHQFSSPPASLDSTGIKKKAESRGLSESELDELIKLYDAEVRHVDIAIKELIDKLKDFGVFENTILVITADHGEELLDHGHIGHVNESLYDEIIHVPLILFNADLEDSVVENQVELLDIPPTILNFLDLDIPDSYLGTSLIENMKNGKETPAVSEYVQLDKNEDIIQETKKVSYREGNWKFIYEKDSTSHELYDLSEDPEESENLYEDEDEKVKDLELKVKRHLNLENEFSNKIRTRYQKNKIKNKIKSSDRENIEQV